MATFIVNNLNDSGEGSLRAAVLSANATPGEDVISFGSIFFDATPDTIVLTSGQLTLTDTAKTTINGSGVQELSISGNNASHIFQVNAGATAAVANLAIINGFASAGGGISNQGTLALINTYLGSNSSRSSGGGIYNRGNLTIENSTISNNQAGGSSYVRASDGGGIFNDGFLSVSNSVFDSNGGFSGAGIYNSAANGSLLINNSLFNKNGAYSNGGAVYNDNSLLSVNGSTFNENYSRLGGAIYNADGIFTINSSTLSSNRADFHGGGIYTNSASDVKNTIVNSTLSGNTAYIIGGGLFNGGGITAIQNSTISQNTTDGIAAGLSILAEFSRIEISNNIVAGNGVNDENAPDLRTVGTASLVSLGNNLVGVADVNGSTSGFIAETGDILVGNDDPGLAPLANNGGFTKTHALLPGSLAINAGNNTLIPNVVTTDQRGTGFSRTAYSKVDIGAFELQLPVVSIGPAVTSQAEGNSGITRYLYTVSLSQASPFAVDVDLNLTGGTATFASGDIVLNLGGTFFAPGETSKQVFVDVQGDADVEPDETFIYSIIGVNNATIAPNASSVTSTILNDDGLPENRHPIAVNDSATVAAYQSVKVDVLANDTDPDGDPLTLSITTNPNKGTASLNDNNTPQNPQDDFITYVPVPGYCGEDSFTYQLEDDKGGTAIATVNITVTGANLVGTAGNDSALVGTNCADTIDGRTGNDRITGKKNNDSLTGGGRQDRFIYALGDGIDTITDFGGVGVQKNPAAAIRAEVDTIQFRGAGLTARNLLLTQAGTDLEVTFESRSNTKIILQNFQLENLENSPTQSNTTPAFGNILFNRQTSIQDSFDVFNANSIRTNLFNRNTVTFLNDLNNIIRGFNNSDDVINAQGGSDSLNGRSGSDLLRGGRGNDTLRGGRGSDTLLGDRGDDRLVGGTQADQFVFSSGRKFKEADFGVDTIVDFSTLENDKIGLSKKSFRTLTSSAGSSLTSNDFASINASKDNSAATLAARIIYNQGTGNLIYNENGAASGFGSGGRFATLSLSLALSTTHFLIKP